MPEITLSFSGVHKTIRADRVLAVAGRAGKVTPALLVAYPSGWYLHPLPAECPVLLNGETLSATARLRVGDAIRAGRGGAITVVASVPAAYRINRLVAPTCEVTATVGATRMSTSASASPFLIGSAAECNLRLSDADIRPHHALLAYADSNWNVHDLTGAGVERLSGDSTSSAVAVSGESVWLGALELSLLCRPLDRVGAAKPGESSRELPAIPVPLADRPTQPMAQAETSETTIHHPETVPLYLSGSQLVRWIQREMPALYAARRGAPAKGGGWFLPSDPASAFKYYQSQLVQYPGDAQLMYAVADRFAALTYTGLERLVLKEMTRYHPKDFPLMLRVAERVFEDAGQAGRPVEERRQDLERAHRYAEIAASLRPAAWEAIELLRRVGVELAVAGLNRQPVEGRP